LVGNVRGILFLDYVRMVRSRKDIDWGKYLDDADFKLLSAVIDTDGWYPMATFERLGIGILREIAHGQLDGVRMWGGFQVDSVRKHLPDLIARNDPRETMMRFRILSRSLFDYGAVTVLSVDDDSAIVGIAYGMSQVAEETASHQSLGFMERLVQMAGGKNVEARFTSKSWAGAECTRIALHWVNP
jgi:hypothetical protein